MCHALVSNYLTASSELNWAGIKKLAIFLYLIWCLFVYEMKEIKKISELGDISRTQRLWSNMRNSCYLWSKLQLAKFEIHSNFGTLFLMAINYIPTFHLRKFLLDMHVAHRYRLKCSSGFSQTFLLFQRIELSISPIDPNRTRVIVFWVM